MAEEWFVALPDSDTGLTAARTLRPSATQVIEHASGRPWVMGHWQDDDVTIAASGRVRVVVAGQSPATTTSLQTLASKARSLDDVGAALAGLPGSFHVIASADGRVRVQGTLAAVRRVFHARVGEAVVAADSARLLAQLTGAHWDSAWLALRLTSMYVPFPLHEDTPWQNVTPVPADHWLCLERDGTACTRRRWSPPDPALTLAEGARSVRAALAGAVEARTAPGGTVTCDLSGGLDSTSLAFLACQGPAQVVTFHQRGRDAANDDTSYARLAAAHLPGARHREHTCDQAGGRFDAFGPEAPPADAEEPYAFETSRAQSEYIARTTAEERPRVHLRGIGGDQLFQPGIAYLHDLIRTRPLLGLNHVRAQRTKDRLPWSRILGPLLARTTPATELARAAERLTTPHPRGWAVDLNWQTTATMPPWATQDAISAARDLLRTRARQGVEPLARRRDQHTVLLFARNSGKAVGRTDVLFRRHGVRLAAPFLDDHVLHAALAVRPEDRLSPYRFKPLLNAAMEGLLPQQIRERTTKGEYSAEFHHDWLRHRRHVLQFIEESELARCGLIDIGAAQRALLAPHTNPSVLIKLDGTLACERWLRTLTTTATAVEPLPDSPRHPDTIEGITP
ncbi:asparagine synthase-related protein [Nonomuraea sp. NPDC003560]|uniref:asparagine synthase-related protein n=1 Tax=Nonomuraea sp. NPDC003560 TaxID=3364341 RepID=UPI0036BAC325